MTAKVIIAPPIITVKVGTSLIPKIGIQTHKTPPTTSIKDNSASSAAGKYLAPKLYKIRPVATNKPCNKLRYEFFIGIVIKGSNEKSNAKNEKNEQKRPARTTVVNLGVSGFQRIVTVYNANPVADITPNSAPAIVPEIESLIIIIVTPIKAIIIAIKVERDSNSPNKKYPKIAAIKGITANIKRVTAALVIVIE